MRTNFIVTKIVFTLFVVCIFSSCDNATPCKCWKYSYYSIHKDECDKAFHKMGFEKWNKKTERCKDYRFIKDTINGYTKLDLVAIKVDDPREYVYKQVYVKE